MKELTDTKIANEFLLILELSGYSALTDVPGGEDAAKIVARLKEIVDEVILTDVRVEERKGDEMILSSKNGVSLLRTCFLLRKSLDDEHNYPSFHAALHFGEIFRQAGGLFSTTINLAARMTAFASTGQIVCSKDFVEHIELPENFKIKSWGEIKFKNIRLSKEVFEISSVQKYEKKKVTDPVCKMTFFVTEDTIKTSHKNNTYHFCSSRCFQYFENHPDMFL